MDVIKEFREELKVVKRKGVLDLMTYLQSTDFFKAPASTRFHGNHEQGLAMHSLYVLDAARHISKLIDEKEAPSEESLIICSLFHDVCKANFYVKGKRNKKTDKGWIEIEVWEVKDQFPMGHGEKSLYLIQKFVKLSNEEALAIRWHLGGFDPGVNFMFPSGGPCMQAFREYPLISVLAAADLMATYVLDEPAKEM